jgi:glycosyltransferase involved in cell wall biosynthesis
MSQRKISVVMPVYNSGQLIHNTIISILNQTYEDFEFIIVNDASKDDTLNIIKEYQKKDKRIKIINNNKNLGISLASNKGLDIAKGKYIAMMDHDDISLPERFEKQIKYLEKNKDVFLIGTGNKYIDKEGNILNKIKTITNPDKIKKEIISGTNRICHPSIMFRNETKIRYREKIYYAQDVDFFLQLLSENKVLTNLPDVLFHYRVHNTQTSMEKRNKQLLFYKKAIDFYNQRIKFGKDKYNQFNPKEILTINPKITKNKEVIETEIFYNFHKQNFKEVKLYSKKYFKLFGYFNKINIYYLISFLPKSVINLILKLKRRLI